MKVFATTYLEEMTEKHVSDKSDWSWNPENEKAYELYASGNNTSSSESTYAAEKDNRSDNDRPNEGMFVA